MNLLYTMAQQQPPFDEKMLIGIITTFLIIALIAIAIKFVINIAICALHYSCLSRLPAEHRKMEPWQVWLLLIPFFNFFWNFIVYQKIPESYHAYFAANGIEGNGDCSKNLGLWYAICTIGALVPCLGYLAAPASLVLLIIFLVKEFELRGKIPRAGAV